MRIVNRIAECDDGKPKARSLESIQKVLVHRIGPQLGALSIESAADVAKWFRIHLEYAL